MQVARKHFSIHLNIVRVIKSGVILLQNFHFTFGSREHSIFDFLDPK